MSEATRLINAASDGDPHAAAELLPLLYQELRRLAQSQMARERPEHTLTATALVHEAYLRLMEDQASNWENRRHFFAAAAEAMRRILVEHARAKQSLKRGGGWERIELDNELPDIALPCDDVIDLLALDKALERFTVEYATQAELVKLRYFAGLTLEEAAAALSISKTTAHRQWKFARAWLHNAVCRE
jgi:RNA polymerase sigma factor (TIGR02999 family)